MSVKHFTRKDGMYILALLAVFSMPFHIQLTRYLVGVLMGVWLLEMVLGRGLKTMLGHLFQQRLVWFVVVFYLLHVASLFLSSNADRALFDLERKLPLLLLPLAFATMPSMGRVRRNHILLSFAAANLLISLICLGVFAARLTDPSYLQKFLNYPLYRFYTDFSLFNKSTYFALYLEVSVAFLLYLYHEGSPVKKGWLAAAVVLLTLLVLAVSSRAAIAGLMVVFVTTILMYGKRLRVKVLSLAGLILLVAVVLGNYRFRNYREMAGRLLRGELIDQQELIQQDAMRLLIWDSALDLSLDHFWLGTGTGDVQQMLNSEYRRRGIHRHMDHNYNPHNQYLSSFLALGITGLVVMLVWMLWPLISAWRDKDYPGMVWMLMMLLHFFFESMLNRSPGVLLFAFFYSLLVVHRYRKEP